MNNVMMLLIVAGFILSSLAVSAPAESNGGNVGTYTVDIDKKNLP